MKYRIGEKSYEIEPILYWFRFHLKPFADSDDLKKKEFFTHKKPLWIKLKF